MKEEAWIGNLRWTLLDLVKKFGFGSMFRSCPTISRALLLEVGTFRCRRLTATIVPFCIVCTSRFYEVFHFWNAPNPRSGQRLGKRNGGILAIFVRHVMMSIKCRIRCGSTMTLMKKSRCGLGTFC
jgi:hypothetical protein